jgi:hypothetical protein
MWYQHNKQRCCAPQKKKNLHLMLLVFKPHLVHLLLQHPAVCYTTPMPFPKEKLTVLQTIDRAFDLGTQENHFLNKWLLVINLILVFFLLFDVFEHLGFIHFTEGFHTVMRDIELVFGMIFLIEFTLRSVFVYIPDKKFFSLYSIVNAVVIISLLAPHFIGNLAVLRFIRILKAFKVYQLNKDFRSYHVEKD